jgi:hypothetical protein
VKKRLQFSNEILKGICKPSQSVTGPVVRQREKEERETAPSTPGRVATLLSLPLIQVCLYTVGGGVVAGLVAWVSGAGPFGLGFFLGSLLALFGLYSLKALTSKVLDQGEGRGLWIFHGMNVVRWFLLAIVYFLLLKISVWCLLGAVASYIWFLAILAWFGIRAAKPVKPAEPVIPDDAAK